MLKKGAGQWAAILSMTGADEGNMRDADAEAAIG
jgi:hypothetical protein